MKKESKYNNEEANFERTRRKVCALNIHEMVIKPTEQYTRMSKTINPLLLLLKPI